MTVTKREVGRKENASQLIIPEGEHPIADDGERKQLVPVREEVGRITPGRGTWTHTGLGDLA